MLGLIQIHGGGVLKFIIFFVFVEFFLRLSKVSFKRNENDLFRVFYFFSYALFSITFLSKEGLTVLPAFHNPARWDASRP